jgi:hypothetical protein
VVINISEESGNHLQDYTASQPRTQFIPIFMSLRRRIGRKGTPITRNGSRYVTCYIIITSKTRLIHFSYDSHTGQITGRTSKRDIARTVGAVMPTLSKLTDTEQNYRHSPLLIHIGLVCAVRNPRTQIISCIYYIHTPVTLRERSGTHVIKLVST